MYSVGIDLGGTNIAVGLVDKEGKIIIKESTPTIKGRSYQEIVKDMALLSKKVIKSSQIKDLKIDHIGIGIPGTPNSKDGIAVYCANLKFINVPMREEMQKYIDLPIYLENDANCAALAESKVGCAKGAKNSIAITLGTGIGAGIIINKKIYTGFNYAAAELGHISIIMNGETCGCGRKGCWEAYASATALIRQTREAAIRDPQSIINTLVNGDLSKVTAKIPFEAVRKGDKTALVVVELYVNYVAEGLVNVINIFQPEIIAIGGGVSREAELLIEPLKGIVKSRTYGSGLVEQTKIERAKMGNDAGIIGAAMLGI